MLANRTSAVVSSNRTAGALAVPVGGRGTWLGFDAYNPGSAVAYLQAFAVEAEDVVLGTTVPVLAYALPVGARRVRPQQPIGARVLSYAVTSTRTGSAVPTEACSVAIAMDGQPSEAETSPADPLSVLDDDFEGEPSDPTDRGWTFFQESTIDTAEVADGELHMVSTTGGAAGAWIYNQYRGNLCYRPVTGDFVVRVRSRVRNAAGDGSPTGGVPVEWRFGGGVNITDPDDSEHNSLHMMFGGDPDGQDRGEWKTIDAAVALWGSVALDGPLDYDAEVARTGQVFVLSVRQYDPEIGPEDEGYVALEDDAGWTVVQTIDRSDNATPARASAVPMPATVWICLTGGYAGPQTNLDIQAWFGGVIVRTP